LESKFEAELEASSNFSPDDSHDDSMSTVKMSFESLDSFPQVGIDSFPCFGPQFVNLTTMMWNQGVCMFWTTLMKLQMQWWPLQ
jgi:hypothetical protein